MAKFNIVIKPSAVKELERLPKKDLQRVASKIQSLADNPRPQGSEKLSGQEQYRIRQVDYRIIYSIDDSIQIVQIVKIGHRREVYR